MVQFQLECCQSQTVPFWHKLVEECEKHEVGDFEIGMFKKLMSAMVDLSMLYGAEIWDCKRSPQEIEQVQLRAFCMFFGVEPCIHKYL